MGEREDEIEALTAIFGDEFRKIDDENIEISVQMLDGRQLELCCILPVGYPQILPRNEIRGSGLTEAAKLALQSQLDRIALESPGDVVVFKWVEWLRDSGHHWIGELHETSSTQQTDTDSSNVHAQSQPANASHSDAVSISLQAAVDAPFSNDTFASHTLPEWVCWNIFDDRNDLGCDVWSELDDDNPVRHIAMAFVMGNHARLGSSAYVRLLDEHLLRLIMGMALSAPLLVPQDFATLANAVNAASHGQCIKLSRGQYLLAQGVSSPTRIDRALRITGERGCILWGGLHMGMDSAGELSHCEVRGHCWIYGGRWRVRNCVIRNRGDVSMVVSNDAVVHIRDCVLGGSSKKKASDGLVVYGNARVVVERCEIQRCGTAITTGGHCHLQVIDCELRDNSSAFTVFRPGKRGDRVEVAGCRILRTGRVWADELRPRAVVEGPGNTVEAASMGEAYWDAACAGGSWQHLNAFLGALAIDPAAAAGAAAGAIALGVAAAGGGGGGGHGGHGVMQPAGV